jgi:uncharacterized protein (TIGR00251 family)
MKQRIKVKIVPSAKVERIENFDGGLKVWIRTKPIEGLANEKLVEILAEYFDVSKSAVKIVLGKTSKDKVVEIG